MAAATLTRPKGLTPELAAIWDEMRPHVTPDIGSPGLEALCVAVLRHRDARARVTADGLLTADARGNAAPHPALAIERAASAEIKGWMERYGRGGG